MMKVWLLFDNDDRIEGVYSEAAKEVREQQFYEEALTNREHHNATIAMEIKELKALRRPYLDDAERLLTEERVAKEINHTGKLKEARKQRKVALRQADKLTYDIRTKEERINNSMLLTYHQLINSYCPYHYWQEEYVLEAE